MVQESYIKVSDISVISLSGGIDSTSLLLKVLSKKTKVYALTFDYGQKHNIEVKKSKFIVKYLKENDFIVNHKIIDISDCVDILDSSLTNPSLEVPKGYYEEQNMLSTVVPNRNAIFTSILYGYALTLSKEHINKNINICLGVHSGDHTIYPDCRQDFYDILIKAFEKGNWDTDNVHLYLPYINSNKASILKDAIESSNKLKVSFNTIFKNTITSYEPNKDGISKGTTGSDIERILAFDEIGIEDPLKYHDCWEIVLGKAKELERKFKN